MALGPEEIDHRFGYHPGTSVTIPKHTQLREAYKAFAVYLNVALPDGRAKSTALTKLQESSMWANFGIAELAPVAVQSDQAPDAQAPDTARAAGSPGVSVTIHDTPDAQADTSRGSTTKSVSMTYDAD